MARLQASRLLSFDPLYGNIIINKQITFNQFKENKGRAVE